MRNTIAGMGRSVAALSLVTTILAVPPPLPAGAAGPFTVEVRVSSSADDAEESVTTGNMSFTSSDLEMVNGGSRGDQVVGVRFTGVTVPRGAHVDSAYVQFQVDEQSSDPTDLIVAAHAADDSPPFTSATFDLSSRPSTTASVSWAPPAWSTVGAAGPDQRTPPLTEVVQELVDRPGWSPGNAVAVIISGSGKRVAEAYDGGAAAAPLLHIEYSTAVWVQAVDDVAIEGTADQGLVRFTRSAPYDTDLTVTYSAGGTATAGSDYGALPGSVLIPAGASSADVVVDVIDDGDVEGTETVVATVMPGTGYVPGSSPEATVSIIDDDTPTITVAASDTTATEGVDPTDAAEFTLTRSGPTDGDVVVLYAMGGEATADADYSLPSGTVTIPSGFTTAAVAITPLDDLASERPESITLTILPGAGYAVGEPPTAGATLIDNDPIADVPVASAADDAEEHPTGSVRLFSGDLEMIHDPTNGDQTVGLRFAVPAPPGSTITAAWIQFQAQEIDLDPASLLIEGQASENAPAFATASFGISSRPRTTASVPWSPPPWDVKREAGPDQRTPGLSEIVQETVDRPGWAAGNTMVFLITGSGRRSADSFDADPAAAPVLHLEYSGAGAPNNAAPLVVARADSVLYGAAATLDGSVTDDGLPDPPGQMSFSWSKVSGPGTVTFADPASEDTTATFSEPGVYELLLTADDGELASSDRVLISAVDPTATQPDRVRAAAFGDYGVACCGEANVAALVSTLAPDIIVTTGDNRYVNDMDHAVGQFFAGYVGNYQGSYGPGSPLNRFFPAPGNHDYSEAGGIDVFLDFFSLPGGAIETSGTSGNERYYDFVWGPVHFFVVNSNPEEPDGRTSTSAQAQWLQTGLAASQSPWQIVYMHHPPYSSGATHGPEPAMQWPYEAWGADAVLAGHDHVYERIVKGSLPYFVVGNGGASLYAQSPSPDPDSQFFYGDDHGLLLIDACAESLGFEFHSVSAGLLDTYTLGAPDCSGASPPNATDDSAATTEDTPVTVDVTGNDTDPDSDLDPAGVSVLTPPANGAALTNGDGTITYTPATDFNGTDAFTYQVCDTGGLCDTATVGVTVDPVPDPPVATDDTAATVENTPITVDVLANDSDVDGDLDPSSVMVATPPSLGTATANGDGTVTYTPAGGATGTDGFTYQVCDLTGLCDTAAVSVDIGAVNDPPAAADDAVATSEDTPVTFDPVANDTDPESGLDRSSALATCPGCSLPSDGSLTSHGDGTFTYSPDPDFNGTDAFTYQVCDSGGLCDTATVTITVSPLPDPPVASDDTAATTEDTPVTVDVLANDSDVDGDALTVASLTDPTNGTATTQPDGTVTYTPAPGFSGVDTFTYTANDGTTDSASATVTVTVGPVPDPPVASDDTATTDEDTPVDVTVLGNDTDPDGDLDPSTLRVLTPPSSGSAAVQPDDTIRYVPATDFHGVDAYIYEVCDAGGLCDIATVTVTVSPVPDPPTASDDTGSTAAGTTVVLDVLGNDTDPDGDLDAATVTVTTAPSAGTAVVQGDHTIAYTPDAGFSGTDSFTYRVCDATALCDSAAVSVNVGGGTVTVDQFALSETTLQGSRSGSLGDTLAADGVYEQITETHSGGSPTNRQSFAEHHWTFDIQRGDAVEVTAVAYHTANPEGDDFSLEYSLDGGAGFLPLFRVTATSGPATYTATLPEVISGPVIVRAVDTDRVPGNGVTDTLFIDLLVIRTTNPQAPLPLVTVTAPDETASESGDPGAFRIRRDDTTGPLTVSFSLTGTATEGADYTALGGSVAFADGQAQATLVVDPLDDALAEGDESVELSIDPGSTYQRGMPSAATVLIADDDVTGSEARAVAETTVAGNIVSGDLASTHFADGQVETIAEELYAGNKRSRLEHVWTFQVGPGSGVSFHLLADHVGGETFVFSYSTDAGSTWSPIPVTASGLAQSAALPASVQGTVLVRVTDGDQSRNEVSIDRVVVDEMYFLSVP